MFLIIFFFLKSWQYNFQLRWAIGRPRLQLLPITLTQIYTPHVKWGNWVNGRSKKAGVITISVQLVDTNTINCVCSICHSVLPIINMLSKNTFFSQNHVVFEGQHFKTHCFSKCHKSSYTSFLIQKWTENPTKRSKYLISYDFVCNKN